MHRLGVLACVGLALTAGAIHPRAQAPVLRFAFDDYQPGVTQVRRLSVDELWTGAGAFKRQATAWFNGTISPTDLPRRRLLIATYVLELLRPLESKSLWSAGQAASSLLDWAWEVLRLTPPTAAERAWWLAAMALLERSAPVDVIQHHLERAEARFPEQDLWLLVRAIIDERERENGRRDDGSLSIAAGLATRARRNYERAAARPSIRAEALIRHGAFESELGRHDVALALFDEAGMPESRVLQYWLHMWKGRALERAGRMDDAAVAYRHALDDFPRSQAAALGYAEALVEAHRTFEAAGATARAVAPDPMRQPDPWDFYRMPDVLQWPAAMDELRGAVAR